MAEIKIKELTLSPFKGIEYYTAAFDGKDAEVSGDNGTGKTTIADAWVWLITGKSFAGLTDSGKAAFSVIPNGGDTAQVSAEITIDGDAITLTRRIEVKAKSKKTRFYLDETEVQKAAFDDFIRDKFRVTDLRPYCVPGAFMELDIKEQRAMLLDNLGHTTTLELSPDEQTVADEIKKIGDFAIWEKGKKNAVKDGKTAITALTESIKTAESLRPEPRDYTAIEQELADLTATKTTTEMPDAWKQAIAKKERIIREFAEIKSAALTRVTLANAVYQDLKNKQAAAVRSDETLRAQMRAQKKGYLQELSQLNKELNNLREVFCIQRDQQRTPSDTSCVKCPICEQINCDNPLILANIEESEKQAAAAFIAAKNKALDDINAKGQRVNAEIDTLNKRVEKINADLENEFVLPLVTEIAEAKAKLEQAQAAVPNAPDTTEIDAEIERAKDEAADITAAEKERTERMKVLSAALAERETAAKVDAKIKAIENQISEQQTALGDAEQKLAIGKKIRRRQMADLENSVNSEFGASIKFRLFEEQVNGDFADTCQLYIDGIPYGRGANRAAEINAALQICEFLQKAANNTNVSLPVFVDNTESVNNLANIEPQTITLRVTDTELTITTK